MNGAIPGAAVPESGAEIAAKDNENGGHQASGMAGCRSVKKVPSD